MPVIPGLPENLRTVPPGLVSDDDPQREQKRSDWRRWRDQVSEYRALRRSECETDLVEQEIERRKCRASSTYFLTVWGHLFEPRKRKKGEGLGGEFILFPRQVEVLDAFHGCLAVTEGGPSSDIVVPKTRDVGASWLFCGEALKQWLFDQEVQIGMASYNETLVESKKPDSLFWKIDFLLNHLPEWMQPKYNDVHLTMTNLDNGNVISGYTTTKHTARGGRFAWILYDEASAFEEFVHTWTASTAAADTRVAVGTMMVNHGPDFWNLSMNEHWPVEERPVRMPIRWFHHPLRDDAWLESERTRYKLDQAGFEREVMLNPFSEDTAFVYPEAHNIVPSGEFTYNPGLPQYNSIDPGFRDDCALVFLQEDPATGLVHVIDGYSNAGLPADYYGSVMSGVPESGQWSYDSEALRIMEFARDRHQIGTRTYGDMYGFNQEGATMDSFYSRLAKYKIWVVRDRLKDGKIAQSRREARSFRGRREAMRELWPRLRFANTPGALAVLDALKMNRYKPGDAARTHEDRQPLHDQTSHYTSAMEYFAVNKKLERQIVARAFMPEQKPHPSRSRSPGSVRWGHAHQSVWGDAA